MDATPGPRVPTRVVPEIAHLAAHKPSLDLSRARVMIVDDHPFSRSLARTALASLNVHDVTIADSAEDGLKLIASAQPDLILVDWVMEPMSGLDFAQAVRRHSSAEIRFIPMIMVSSHAELWRVEMARDTGVNEYVAKPYTAKVLYKKIRAIVEGNRPFVAVPTCGYFGPDRRRRAAPVTVDRRGTGRTRTEASDDAAA
jgi:two-component system, chemotaxis family, chemotaxis protein CheY